MQYNTLQSANTSSKSQLGGLSSTNSGPSSSLHNNRVSILPEQKHHNLLDKNALKKKKQVQFTFN